MVAIQYLLPTLVAVVVAVVMGRKLPDTKQNRWIVSVAVIVAASSIWSYKIWWLALIVGLAAVGILAFQHKKAGVEIQHFVTFGVIIVVATVVSRETIPPLSHIGLLVVVAAAIFLAAKRSEQIKK